jgi:hypothetical protein
MLMGGIPEGNGGHARPEGCGTTDQSQLLIKAQLLQQCFSSGPESGTEWIHSVTLWHSNVIRCLNTNKPQPCIICAQADD